MNVLIVYAHPEPRSLTAALRDVAVAELAAQGHEVRVSDLYAMGWKPLVDHADFRNTHPMRGCWWPRPRPRRSRPAR